MKKVCVVGTGYVGLVTGTCFAEMGNKVICVDVDKSKIDMLNNGRVPIYEPKLEQMVERNLKLGSLSFITDLSHAIKNSDICFIAVGTPMTEDGSADLQHVLDVAHEIGRLISHPMIIVNKSTVPVGTAEKVRDTINEELAKENRKIKFEVVSNPEFLKEGNAVDDFMKPDRVIVGTENEETIHIMKELYAPFTLSRERLIVMDVRSAELTKYTANAMLATKISFMNELANICERVGADINKIRVGIGSDSRIGYSFIYPGAGFGGSCFPKDVSALEKTALEYGYTPRIIQAVKSVNNEQKYLIVDKIIKRFGKNLDGLVFALWGLSFKPETDDMREAPSITIIRELTGMGARIKAYDPQAMEVAKKYYLNDIDKIDYVDSKYSTLNGAAALILITEWKEFRSPDFEEIAKQLDNKIIFDGRNQYNKEELKEMGFEYYQIGVPSNPD